MSLATKLALVGALACLAVVASVPAAEAASKSFAVTGHRGSADPLFYFTFDGVEGKNPTVALTAGDSITITANSSDTVPHNFQVGYPTKVAGPTTTFKGDQKETLTFTVPGDARELTYICTIHGEGMSGKFTIAGATTGSGGSKSTPGLGFAAGALALVGAAFVLARRSN